MASILDAARKLGIRDAQGWTHGSPQAWRTRPAHRQAHRRPTARDPAAAATSANLPQKAAHTATGGARGRNRSRSPVMGANVGLRGARRRPHGGHRTGSGWTRITPDRSPPRWRVRQPRWPRPPGIAARGALLDLPGGAPRQDGDLDGDDTVLHHLQLSRGGVRDVEDATVVQGFGGDPVVDPKHYFAVVVQVANADARIERQIVVGRGELVAVERLAASGRLPVECVAVPARQTAAYVAVGDQLVASLSSTSALTNAATIFGTAGTRSPHGHEKRSNLAVAFR